MTSSFAISTPHQILFSCRIDKIDMDAVNVMYGGTGEGHLGFWWGSPKERG